MANSEESTSLAILSDALLVQRFRDGDVTSFEELFQRHYDRVYGLLFRLVGTRQEAEDLAQEVFLRLYRKPLARVDNVSGWLYRVAMNTGYNALRTHTRRIKREQTNMRHSEPVPSAETTAVRRESEHAVRAALAKIPSRSAQLLIMRQMGFSYRELAEAVGVAYGSVGTLLNRAGEAFRKAYQEGKMGDQDAY